MYSKKLKSSLSLLGNNEESWKTVEKKGTKSIDKDDEELTEAELEAKRELRRQRRRKAKEAKKRQKEEDKRVALQGAKDTKIKLVTADIVSKAKTTSSTHQTSRAERLRFFDEEYPTLGQKSKTLPTPPRKTQANEKSRESGSEWETEDENEVVHDDSHPREGSVEESKIPKIVQDEDTDKSYSSILKTLSKSRQLSNPVLNELSDDLVKNKTEGKKVKKRDPITVDIFEAFNKNKKKNQGSNNVQKTIVHGSKINKVSTSLARNALDSTAPTKRRGKEREKPRKKKPTTMKKLILLDREERAILRNSTTSASTKETTVEAECVDNKLTVENDSETIIDKPTTSVSLPIQSDIEKAKLQLHSRKFRR